MILTKETKIKFGYYPRELSWKSKKHVMFKCSCGKIRPTPMAAIQRSPSGGKCKSCAGKFALSKHDLRRANNQRDKIQDSEVIEMSPELLFSLIKSSSVYLHKDDGRHTPKLMKDARTASLSVSYPIFKSLNLDIETIPKNTVLWKAYLAHFLSKQTRKFRWEVLNHAVKHHTASVSTVSLTLTLKDERYRCIFEGFEGLNYVKTRSNFRITNGSFYVDGRWIHVG